MPGEERVFPQETTRISLNGRRLNVEIQGPPGGQPAILLHHGLGSVRAWKAQLPALAGAGYRAIAYDRWGYGDSDPRPRLSVPDFTDDLQDLEALLVVLDINQPVILIGHSDGGTIALYFAALHPQDVTALVSVAAHIYVEPKMKPGIRSVRRAYENDAGFRQGLRRVHGEKADQVFYNWFNGWWSPGNRDWDMRPVLAQVSCPTLVVQGVEDEHATPQHARDIAAAIPGAKLWLVPAAGHMLPQDKPQEFNRRVIEFLGEETYV